MFHVSTLLPYTPNNKQQVRMESCTPEGFGEKRSCVKSERLKSAVFL